MTGCYLHGERVQQRTQPVFHCGARLVSVASAAQLAVTLQANRSLIFRILSTLGERGFVVKDSQNLYWLGPQLLYLGLQAGGENLLINASSRVMDELLEQTQESIVLILRDHLETVRVAYRDSSHLIRVPTGFAAKGGLHEGGASKILLAHAPEVLLIPGTSSLSHLAENVATGQVDLDDETLAVLDRLGDPARS